MKLFIFFIFALFSFRVFAAHPLNEPNNTIRIKEDQEEEGIIFLPIKQIDGCVIGAFLFEGTNNVFFYVAIEKMENVSDVYILKASSTEREIFALYEIKKIYENRIRVRMDGLSGFTYFSFEKIDYIPENDEVVNSELFKKILVFAQDIINLYKKDGRSEVKSKYGESAIERLSKEEKQAANNRTNAKRKKKKDNNPKIDKRGCIAYVNDNDLVRVIAKKASYDGNYFSWAVKVKNVSDYYIRTCFVNIKCLDEDGFNVTDGIESADNIAPGEERIISGRTFPRCSAREAKKVKIKQFEISAHL